jgi:hypothetical protein
MEIFEPGQNVTSTPDLARGVGHKFEFGPFLPGLFDLRNGSSCPVSGRVCRNFPVTIPATLLTADFTFALSACQVRATASARSNPSTASMKSLIEDEQEKKNREMNDAFAELLVVESTESRKKSQEESERGIRAGADWRDEVAAASARNSADMFPALEGLTLSLPRSAGGAVKVTRRD